jgi:hypothetical protein
LKVAKGIPLIIGVERHESSNSAKAISSKMVRGVAGLSNMVRGGRHCAQKKKTFQAKGRIKNK